LFENRGDGRFIQRMYMRNIADIIPNGSDICSTADIPELSEIVAEGEPLERKSFKKAHEKRRVIRWELTKKYLTASLGS